VRRHRLPDRFTTVTPAAGEPTFQRSKPDDVQVLRTAPVKPHVRLGEVRAVPSDKLVAAETVEAALRKSAATLGADAVVVVLDPTQVVGPMSPGRGMAGRSTIWRKARWLSPSPSSIIGATRNRRECRPTNSPCRPGRRAAAWGGLPIPCPLRFTARDGSGAGRRNPPADQGVQVQRVVPDYEAGTLDPVRGGETLQRTQPLHTAADGTFDWTASSQ